MCTENTGENDGEKKIEKVNIKLHFCNFLVTI